MRARRLVLAGGAIALLAGALAVRAIGRDPASGPAAPGAARDPARGATDGGRAAAALRVVPDPAAEVLPGVHCWDGLLALDRAGSLADVRAALARAAASGDELLVAYLEDRLVELVGDDVARALQLLDWADAAGGVELEVLLRALARAGAVHDRAVAARLLRAGEDAAAPEGRRAAALAALETQRRLGRDDLARLRAIALEQDGGAAAWTATRTIGRVMKEDFDRTGTYAPYWEQLVDVARTTGDEAVRVLALEMPAYVDPILGREYIDDLAAMLRTAPERGIREMAAFQLGLTEDPDRVLGVFRAAFPHEREVCVRWAMFRFSVRAAGPRAIPTLEEMARIDPRFRVDLDEFRRSYAAGVHDFERVWLDKAEHHPCQTEGHDDHGHDPEGAS